MKVLLVSPYHTGSHKNWAEGYLKHSRYDVELLTLPGRFWKWRMHGGAVTLARRALTQKEGPDVLLCTDMLDLSTFLALTRKLTSDIPCVLFMHENQLTYPLPLDSAKGPMRRQKGERDLHYSFVNFGSMLAADEVWFNSGFHRTELLNALPRFLKRFPDFRELGSLASVRRKSRVMPLGLEIDDMPREAGSDDSSSVPLVLWNQRWEYDKNPTLLFDVLMEAAEEGCEFDLALAGESFQSQPEEFATALKTLEDRIVHQGFASRKRYRELLAKADIVVSTAIHEFFGIAVLEAIRFRTFPILPCRLSYPEVIPSEYHRSCLYRTRQGFLSRLKSALENRQLASSIATELAERVSVFDWPRTAQLYDEELDRLAVR